MQEYLRETAQVCDRSVAAGAENDVKATVIVLDYSRSLSLCIHVCYVRLSIAKYSRAIKIVCTVGCVCLFCFVCETALVNRLQCSTECIIQ